MQKDFICGEMAQSESKFFSLYGNVASEMGVSDIPVAPNADVEALKKGDSDPLEVVMEVPASESTRGWYYSSDSLRDIVNHVNNQTLNGFLGHQKPEDVSNQFLPPVTHWIGAKMEGESAFFRGVVDASATDLKRWIRSKRIDQVSIFGIPKLRKEKGKTTVVGYKPLSIDWVPKGRAGMNTRIVAMSGEMWDMEGEGPSGEMEDVSETTEEDKGDEPMKPEEILSALKEAYENKQITPTMIQKSLGVEPVQLAGEMDSTIIEKHDTLNDVAEVLGVSGEMDVIEVAKEAKKALDEQADFRFEKVVGEMAEEKIQSEAVRKDLLDTKTPIGKMWALHAQAIDKTSNKDAIAGEMDSFLKDEAVQSLIQSKAVSGGVVNPLGNQSTSTATRRRTVSIY